MPGEKTTVSILSDTKMVRLLSGAPFKKAGSRLIFRSTYGIRRKNITIDYFFVEPFSSFEYT